MNALNKIQYKYATWRNLRRQFLSEQATLAEVREMCVWRGTHTGISSRNHHSPCFVASNGIGTTWHVRSSSSLHRSEM